MSGDAYTPTVGENERIIRDRTSSEPSTRPSIGETRVDLANWGVDDLTDLACGELDLRGSSEVAVGRDGVEGTLDPTTSKSREGEDACWSEYLALEATR